MKALSIITLTTLLVGISCVGCKDAPDSTPKRPQDPTSYPYKQEEVTFVNPKAGNKLSGTLTMPLIGKASKIVVLISGSGPQNRNEENIRVNHRPFLVLSDWLTRNGIAVLRYDDRGVGKSTGNFSTATTADFVDDAEAAVNYIRSRSDLTELSIGLIGHSEGGIIAPMVASRNDAVSFICLMAGAGLPIEQVMQKQTKDVLRVEGITAADIQIALSANQNAFNLLKDNAGLSPAELKVKIDAFLLKDTQRFPKSLLRGMTINEFIKSKSALLNAPWTSYFLRLNPSDYLLKVKCPVLALNGTLDVIISSKDNLAAIDSILQSAGNKNHQQIAFRGLNHLFQEAKTGADSEYAQIEETINPQVLKTISNWINSVK